MRKETSLDSRGKPGAKSSQQPRSAAQEKDGRGNALSKQLALLPGLSLYWAWIWALLIIDNRTFSAGSALAGLPASVTEYAIRAFALALVVVFARMLPARIIITWSAPTGAVLGVFGVVLLIATRMNDFAPLLAMAWTCIGAADGLLIMGWLVLYRFVGLRRASIALCTSSLLGTAVVFIVWLLPEPLDCAVMLALPVACALTLKAASKAQPPAVQQGLAAPSSKPTSHAFGYPRLAAFITLYGLVFGCMQALIIASPYSIPPFGLRLGAIMLGGIAGLATCTLPTEARTRIIYRAALPLTAAGLLLAPLAGGQLILANLFVTAGFVLFDLISITLLIRLAALYALPAPAALGIGRIANAIGICLGWLVGYALTATIGTNSDLIATLGAILVLALIVASGSLLEGKTFDRRDEEQRQRKNGSEPLQSRWRRQCDLVSVKHGLSPRESEVLMLLAKGRNADYIANLFVISPHTAKTHIHNTYKKLGIHSQQDLIDLVEAAASELDQP